MRMKFECMNQKYLPPVTSYLKGDGTSITVGYVYRGTVLPAQFQGVLFYADRISGKIWGLKYSGGKVESNTLLLDSGKDVSAFGEASNGELYLADYTSGNIFKVSVTVREP